MNSNDIEILKERLEARREIDPHTGCWLWTSYRDPKGYGVFKFKKITVTSHRWARLAYKGDPLNSSNNQFNWDHLCRVRACFNPDHLELVSAKENKNRGKPVSARQLGVCKRGHEMTDENTLYKNQKVNGKVYRFSLCALCLRENQKKADRNYKAKKLARQAAV